MAFESLFLLHPYPGPVSQNPVSAKLCPCIFNTTRSDISMTRVPVTRRSSETIEEITKVRPSAAIGVIFSTFKFL